MLKDAAIDLLPIVAVLSFFQVFIISEIPENLGSIVLGLGTVLFGLVFFIRGLEIGIFPIGENLANDFARKGSLFWLLLFAFLIGFSTTIAEPALIAIASKAQIISDGRIDALFLRLSVALSVGFAIALGSYRIIVGHPIHYYIIGGYILVVAVTYFAPVEIIGLAYDSGGVTTSTVTVPLVAALGVGLASSIKGRDPVIDGFGLIAFASLTPMIFVQVYGILVYAIDFHTTVNVMEVVNATQEVAKQHYLKVLIIEFIKVIRDIFPILAVIFFFQYLVIKKQIAHLKRVSGGILLVVFGLFYFIIGLDMALFPIGETMALQLTKMNNENIIYLFGFSIGFATTMAEPALIAIALKVEEISQGKIKQFTLRISVAIGVAIGIALGAYRIVQGEAIHLYIIAGYIIVVVLTFFAPKYIIPIAYDSGGVTTSTVTVPLVAALGLGLATNIEGRSPLIDGFGLIAFASLFPMITVMIYGIFSELGSKKLNSTKGIK